MKNYEKLFKLKKIERQRLFEKEFNKHSNDYWCEIENEFANKNWKPTLRFTQRAFSRYARMLHNWLRSDVVEEEWRPTHIYGDYYEVSDRGRVRSIDRVVENSSVSGGKQNLTGKILKQSLNTKGYPMVYLNKNGIKKTILVHRLMLMAFDPRDNQDELQGNHKNGNKLDNRFPENVEWMTSRENRKHADDMGFRGSKFDNDI